MSPEAGWLASNATRGRVCSMRGFTLIELMIVVGIVAILAAIVFPSYQDSIRKARRTEARAALTTILQLMERYNTEHNSYAGAQVGAGGTIPYDNISENGYYSLDIPVFGSGGVLRGNYGATATPVPGKGQDLDACGTFSLDVTGVRGSSGADPSVCW